MEILPLEQLGPPNAHKAHAMCQAVFKALGMQPWIKVTESFHFGCW